MEKDGGRDKRFAPHVHTAARAVSFEARSQLCIYNMNVHRESYLLRPTTEFGHGVGLGIAGNPLGHIVSYY